MGTSTIFIRFNDLHGLLADMSKDELKQIDGLTPFGKNQIQIRGWRSAMELHNGNVYPLVFWYGRLIRLTGGPKELAEPYYNRFTGKHERLSEWAVLRRYLKNMLSELDREYRNAQKKRSSDKRKSAI